MTTDDVKRIEVPVFGMSCEGCVERVQTALAAARGVRSAEVSLAQRHATVTFSPSETTPDAIASVIEQAGYKTRK
ncbi:MAG: heavy-metal-associated domain-containing protein [Polyangiaceae bacterium]|nr:heavy-metal-associated domain-containing protein [Polyangiaceae bacterium]